MKKFGVKISNLVLYYDTKEQALELIEKVIDCDVVEVDYNDKERPVKLSFKFFIKNLDDYKELPKVPED